MENIWNKYDREKWLICFKITMKKNRWDLPFKNPIIPIFHQFSSVAQSCPTLCNPMECSMPGFPVHHQLLEFTQTYVHYSKRLVIKDLAMIMSYGSAYVFFQEFYSFGGVTCRSLIHEMDNFSLHRGRVFLFFQWVTSFWEVQRVWKYIMICGKFVTSFIFFYEVCVSEHRLWFAWYFLSHTKIVATPGLWSLLVMNIESPRSF